ncbi:MAG TPA: hypothetical protein VGC49_10935 [Solirubrobacterales bacterium]
MKLFGGFTGSFGPSHLGGSVSSAAFNFDSNCETSVAPPEPSPPLVPALVELSLPPQALTPIASAAKTTTLRASAAQRGNCRREPLLLVASFTLSSFDSGNNRETTARAAALALSSAVQTVVDSEEIFNILPKTERNVQTAHFDW